MSSKGKITTYIINVAKHHLDSQHKAKINKLRGILAKEFESKYLGLSKPFLEWK